ncbi:MAG: copper resistance protein B [Sedimenticolaceae bacterium]
MKITTYGLVAVLTLPGLTQAASKDDPVLAKVMIDLLEVRATDGPDPWVLDAQGWVGQDLNKFWLKVEGEYLDGKTTEAEVQALYSRAIAPYWDLQVGWRHDIRPEPSRDWLAIGVEGLAPYWFDLEGTAFIGEGGQLAARLKGEYEWMFTQRWVLSPELEMDLHSKNDEKVGVGSGLSDLLLGMRLRYEIRRELAPYLGVNWTKTFGNTADFARDEGEDTNDVQIVAGLRAWF